MKYRKKDTANNVNVLGMLHIVDVRLVKKSTNEKIKHRLLVVGCEAADIERKVKWIFDFSKYDQFSITNVEKVREKVHTLSTTITQANENAETRVKRGDESVVVPQGKQIIEKYDPKLYAIGIATTMMAKDEEHALRKVGHAIITSVSDVKSHSGASLSDDSTVTIENIPLSSGYAKPKDVSNEVNKAHFVRG